MGAGAVGNLMVRKAGDSEIAVHVVDLSQGFIAQFVAGEGLQAVPLAGDQLDARRGLP